MKKTRKENEDWLSFSLVVITLRIPFFFCLPPCFFVFFIYSFNSSSSFFHAFLLSFLKFRSPEKRPSPPPQQMPYSEKRLKKADKLVHFSFSFFLLLERGRRLLCTRYYLLHCLAFVPPIYETDGGQGRRGKWKPKCHSGRERTRTSADDGAMFTATAASRLHIHDIPLRWGGWHDWSSSNGDTHTHGQRKEKKI